MVEPIQYFFDQHISSVVARALQRRGVDVLTAHAAGRCGFPDSEQLNFAAVQQRVMASFDSDYLALHQCRVKHAGIAWCPASKYSDRQLIQLLYLLYMVSDRDEMLNQVEYL